MIWPPGNTMPDGWFQPSGTNAGWNVDNGFYYDPNSNGSEGTYSLKSGTISHGQVAAIETPSLNCSAGNVTFVYMMESEYSYDFLRFYIDGSEVFARSGMWWWGDELPSFSISAGYHVFKWEYSKDGSVSSGADAAWIDNVSIPVDNSTTVNVTGSESDFSYNDFQIIQASDALVKVDGSEIVSAFGDSIGGATGEASTVGFESDFGWQDLTGTVADSVSIPVLGSQESFSDNSSGIPVTVSIDVTGSQSSFDFSNPTSVTGNASVFCSGTLIPISRGASSAFGNNARVYLEGFQESFGSDSSIGSVAPTVNVSGFQIEFEDGSVSTFTVNSGARVNIETDLLLLQSDYLQAVYGYSNATNCVLDRNSLYRSINLNQDNITVTSSNLTDYTTNSVFATLARNSGKWYFEFEAKSNVFNSSFGCYAGLIRSDSAIVNSGVLPGFDNNSYGYSQYNGYVYHNGNSYPYSGWGWSSIGDHLCIAVDLDAGKIWFGYTYNGSITWFFSGNPATGANPVYTDVFGDFIPALFYGALYSATPRSVRAKFNRELFAGNVPSGFTGWGDIPIVSVSASGFQISSDYGVPEGQGFADIVTEGFEIDTQYSNPSVFGNNARVFVFGDQLNFDTGIATAAASATVTLAEGNSISIYTKNVKAAGDPVGWPTNDSIPSGWSVDSGTRIWTIDRTDFYEGSASIKSGYASSSFSASVLQSNSIACVEGRVRFRAKGEIQKIGRTTVSYLQFRIDGTTVFTCNLNSDWTTYSYPIFAGNHTFAWQFYMGSPVVTTDRMWIDGFEFGISDPIQEPLTWTWGSSYTGEGVTGLPPSWIEDEDSDVPWFRTATSEDSYQDLNFQLFQKSFKSGSIVENQKSSMKTPAYLTRAGNVTFVFRVPSRDISGVGFNWLRFYVDDILQNEWSGIEEWTRVSFSVSSGTHIFKWEYSKESQNSNGSWEDILEDCAQVTKIFFPDTFDSENDDWPYHNSIPSYFEQGSTNDTDWAVDLVTRYSGEGSLKAGDLQTNHWTSNLSTGWVTCRTGTGSFRYKGHIDYMSTVYFQIEGPLSQYITLIENQTSSGGWRIYEFSLPQFGEYRFSWFVGKGSGEVSVKEFWVDSFTIPGGFLVALECDLNYRLTVDADFKTFSKIRIQTENLSNSTILTYLNNSHNALYDINDLVLQAHTSAYKHAQSAAHAAHVLHTVPSAAFLVGAYNVENTVQCAHSAQYEAPLQVSHSSSSDFSHQISSAHNALSGALQKIIKPHTTYSPTISSLKAQQIWISDHDSDLKVQVGFAFVYHVVQPPVLAPFVVELTKT